MSRFSAMLFILFFCPFFVSAQHHSPVGSYQLNADLRGLLIISRKADTLWFAQQGGGAGKLLPRADGRYKMDGMSPDVLVDFKAATADSLAKMLISMGGKTHECFRLNTDTVMPKAGRHPNRQNGFTRADTLRGMLSPVRACYDVTWYHLDVSIDPENRTVGGSNCIRFTATQPFREMQVDLYENMLIDSIVFHGRRLPYRREFDAVFLQLPQTLPAGKKNELTVYYHGRPQVPDVAVPMNGGFLWRRDETGKHFAQVVCQGSGASLWWPNKDHLSDEPDSMLISVTVPAGLQNISNGRLRSRAILPDRRVKTTWAVTYPINNYNVTVNIGNYQHRADTFTRSGQALPIDIYYLPGREREAAFLLAKARGMLPVYEYNFGPYPFQADGFRLIETPYPMEHQSIVALGGFRTDTAGLAELLWHEVAHEWWGNSVSCRDFADFWLHEGFATYAEVMMIAEERGLQNALKRLAKEQPANKEPVTGVRNVNHIHYGMWDSYSKGCRIIHTLRHIIDDDAVFRSLLRGIQDKFKYRTVTENDITAYISHKTGLQLDGFFDQYLHQTGVPELQLRFERQGVNLLVNYRWSGTVANFVMPVKVTLAGGRFGFIRPSQSWQKMLVVDLDEKAFSADTEGFYITTKTLTDGPPAPPPH